MPAKGHRKPNKLSARLIVRVTKKQLARYAEAAGRAGMPRAAWVRIALDAAESKEMGDE